MKVSIITPVYNTEKYLNKCLDSAMNQTLQDFELILINDGSKDGSLNILKEYESKYPDKVTVIDKINEGQAVARNQGLKIAKGEFIFFLDSDDWIEEKALETLYSRAIKDNSDIVACKYAYFNEDGEVISRNIELDFDDVMKRYIISETGPCAKLIKKDLITNNSLYFLEHHIYEDIAVVPAYSLYANKISYVEEELYYYLQRVGSTMKQATYSDKMLDIFNAMKNLRILFENAKMEEKYKEELEYLFIEHLLHASSLRFFKFDNYKENIDRVSKMMEEYYPNWEKNSYLKQEGFKYKLVCKAFYTKKYWFLKLVLKR